MDKAPTPDQPAPEGDLYDEPLRIAGFKGTADEIEQQWYEQVYRGRGDVLPQLTWRALAMGTVIGGVLSLTNIYIGLKSGWSIGVTITACITSFGLWSALLRTGIARTPMTILENNCMQSTASAAGYSTGCTLISAFAAYYAINGHPLAFGLTVGWVFFVAMLGVTTAIPVKRQLVNVEQLRFPSGIATAETLRALYARGERSRQASRALGLAAIASALSAFWADGLRLVSAKLEPYSISTLVERFNAAVLGPAWTHRTVMLLWDPVFVAAGVLMGLRPAASILLGGTLCWAVYVPLLQSNGLVTTTAYRDLVQWTVWGGVACMVVSGLLSVALEWRTVFRAFRGLTSSFGGTTREPTPVDLLEVPTSWFVAGQLVSLVGLAWLAKVSFDMAVWQSCVAVALAFFLALVAARVTGETDTTPTGAMGKISQLVFGWLSPGNMNVNLMSASIGGGAAISAADLLGDLKSGYLLGANPRKQFLAQFAGIFIGSLASVFAFMMILPTADVVGSDRFPAPAAQTWRAVALALAHGFDSLEPVKMWSIVVGAAVGLLLTLVPRWVPRSANWLPSASGVGLAWTFHWYYGFLFFTGAALAALSEQRDRAWSEVYNVPIAAGIMAGGALMGVLLVFWENGPTVLGQMLGLP
jgi:putative OPT family oligopeptide transporter